MYQTDQDLLDDDGTNQKLTLIKCITSVGWNHSS